MLSGTAFTCGPRPEPIFRADHTVIGTGHHGMSVGTSSVASASDCYGQRHQFRLGPRMSGNGASTSPRNVPARSADHTIADPPTGIGGGSLCLLPDLSHLANARLAPGR